MSYMASAVATPMHFRDAEDRKRREQELKCYTEKKKELNKNYEDAMKDRMTRETLGIQLEKPEPVKVDINSKLDTLRNILTQDVLKNANDVSKVLALGPNYIDFISTNIGDIKKYLGEKVDFNYFKSFIDDYTRQKSRQEMGLPMEKGSLFTRIQQQTNPTTTTSSTPTIVRGQGFYQTKKMKVGRGINENSEPKLVEFGRYNLHVPFLKKNLLTIRHKSGANVSCIPRINISNTFKNLILELINTKKVNQRLYSSLDNSEKVLFHDVVNKCNIDETLNLIQDESVIENKDYDRFLLLQGEIASGNNSIEILREFRSLTLKFMKDGSISRLKGLELLSEISVLV